MRPLPERDTEIGGENPRFPETHHSALFGVRGETLARRALDYGAVAAAYWKPVYCYIRVKWSKSNEDAKDLTQAFFAFSVEKDLLRPFDRERGTFRTYLRTCLDRFLANQHRFESRQKRGGLTLPLDGKLADDVVSTEESPEETFEKEFARGLFAAAIEQLRIELPRLPFEVFQYYDLSDSPEPRTYQSIADLLDIRITAVTNHLALARRELRRILLDRLRPITRDESELRREARALFRP
jgi:RNA polymerase sigma factor (sigma-70 family)